MWRDSRLQLLLAIGSLTVMTGAVIAPNLPEIIHQLHLEPGVAGTLVSLHFLTVALSVPLFGVLADAVGALPVLIPALVCYGLLGVAGAAMSSLIPLMVMRGLLGVATGGITAASLGLLGKLYQGDERSQVLAYAASTISLANIVYPLLAGWLGSFSWQLAFGLYGVALPLAIAASSVFRKTSTLESDTTSPSSDPAVTSLSHTLPQLLRHPPTLRLLLALGTTSGIVYASIVYIPLYMRMTLAANTILIAIVLASKAMGATIISAFGTRPIAKACGNLGAIALGYGVMAFTLILLPQLHEFALILPTAIVFGMGFGIVVPSLYGTLSNQASTQLQSSILAAGTGSGFFGQFLSPILLAPVFTNGGISVVFYTAAIVALGAGLLIVSLGQHRTNHATLGKR
ncbi:MAG TPA: MFS transporter [Cyanophyceae cyanobacterium]